MNNEVANYIVAAFAVGAGAIALYLIKEFLKTIKDLKEIVIYLKLKIIENEKSNDNITKNCQLRGREIDAKFKEIYDRLTDIEIEQAEIKVKISK